MWIRLSEANRQAALRRWHDEPSSFNVAQVAKSKKHRLRLSASLKTSPLARAHRERFVGVAKTSEHREAISRAKHEQPTPQSRRWTHIERSYGVNVAVISQTQHGLCGICGERPWVLADHDGVSGEFRGLVCDVCNRLLALAHDDVDVLKRAAAYLLLREAVA